MLTEEIKSQHANLTSGCGYVALESPTIIRMTGADRKSFLHSFCTADIKSLETGNSTEAFILNTKGKILSHVHVLSTEDELLLLTVPGQFETIHGHLDKYIIREDVQMNDAGSEYQLTFVAGNHAAGKLSAVAGVLPKKNSWKRRQENESLLIANLELAGFGYLLVNATEDNPELLAQLVAEGIEPASAEAMEIIRIENGTPRFCVDASEDNLPQELQRDDKAISFTKGCYLGQETVARIDAIGHVNQLFVRLELDSEPQIGIELISEEKKAGRCTSACWSPTQEAWIGLGYVRRALATEGTQLSFEGGSCTVIE